MNGFESDVAAFIADSSADKKTIERKLKDLTDKANGIAYFSMSRQLDFSYLVGQQSALKVSPILDVTSEAMVKLWDANINGLYSRIVEMLTALNLRVQEYNMISESDRDIVPNKKVSRAA